MKMTKFNIYTYIYIYIYIHHFRAGNGNYEKKCMSQLSAANVKMELITDVKHLELNQFFSWIKPSREWESYCRAINL